MFFVVLQSFSIFPKKTSQNRWLKMKGRNRNQDQFNLLQASLRNMLNPKDPLYQLADSIDWEYFEREFSKYHIDFGRPAKPIRLMVSLLILKQMHSISDDEVVETWRQNPYWSQRDLYETIFFRYGCISMEIALCVQ